MARVFTVNWAKAAGVRASAPLFEIKEMMIASGHWTVIGSGDGSTTFAYSGVTAALDPADQGSGGAYDCLKTATGGDAGGAGDWGPGGWCVFQDGNGREVLFVDTDQTPASSWNGYGKIAYARSGGFDGSVAAHSTIPGAASGEQFLVGSRSSDNDIFGFYTDGFVHFWVHDSEVNGLAGFGWVMVTSAGALSRSLIFSSCENGDGPDTDGVWFRDGATFLASERAGYWASACTPEPDATVSVMPQGGEDVLVRVIPLTQTSDAMTSLVLGSSTDIVKIMSGARSYPDVITDQKGNIWVPVGTNSSYGFPFPAATTPSGGTGAARSAIIFDPPIDTPVEIEGSAGGGGVSLTYRNRVWDTVSGGHVRWDTSIADTAGTSYPGPGTFGVDTSDYCVERIS